MGGKTHIYRVLIGNPSRKMLSGRCSRDWRDGTEMDLKEVVWESVD
jgi:hypothetical protein